MKPKNLNLPLDEFIDLALYDKKNGYYIKNNPFGSKGDFVTSPNLSRLFSEMIAIWIISFWQSLGSPKNFNLVELGAGNGEMMRVVLESFKNFPIFFVSCKIFIHEKSSTLIKIQKKKLEGNKIIWISNLNKLNKRPTIFIANEFFDSIPIKQFIKSKKTWFEKFVKIEKNKKAFFFKKKFNMKKFEKKIKLNISHKQKFIEYSEIGIDYLKIISNIIKKNEGGILIIDYGYFENKMKNTLKAISNKEYSNVIENIGNSDITHNLNFNLFKKVIKKIKNINEYTTSQRNFLLEMGIKQRAEIISKKLTFMKKADVYYRLRRLIDEKQMGNLFKVMLIKKKHHKFDLGFSSD